MKPLPPPVQGIVQGFGRREATYTDRVPRVMLLVTAAILVVLAVLAAISPLLPSRHPGNVTGPIVLAVILLALAVAAAGLGRLLDHTVYVFANGFVVTRGSRVDASIGWDEIETIELPGRASGKVWYRDRTGGLHTFSFWFLGWRLRRRCVLEMRRRGRRRPTTPS